MTYRAHVKNGIVVLDGNVKLPEGAEVTVALNESGKVDTISDAIADLVDDSTELPADASKNKRHYLYGQQKS